MSFKSPYEAALSLIDSAHSLDPNKLSGSEIPYELHYAQKCTAYLRALCPSSSDQHEPSAALRLAIRAQHFRRWEVPRSSYPDGRAGYLRWRSNLKTRQAELVKAICLEAKMTEGEAERVAALIRKEGLNKDDKETQILEDVACLVFLDDQFEEFEKGHDEEKIVGILRKTWGKMSERGREEALKMRMEGRAKELVAKALEKGSETPNTNDLIRP